MSDETEQSNTNNIVIGIVVAVIIFAIIFYFKSNSNKVVYNTPEVDRPFLGGENTEMVLTEYSDFACPFCAKASFAVKDLLKKHEGKIKFEYRHFPLSSIHSNAKQAAVASECANDQGKFWQYHDKLFEVNSNSEFTKGNLRKYAEELEMDVDLWQTCMDSDEREKIVRSDSREAAKLNLNSTPSFLLNGSPIKEWNNLDKIIELELNHLEKDE